MRGVPSVQKRREGCPGGILVVLLSRFSRDLGHTTEILYAAGSFEGGGSGGSERAGPTASLHRSAARLAEGLREYTKSGHASASKDFVPDAFEVQRSLEFTDGFLEFHQVAQFTWFVEIKTQLEVPKNIWEFIENFKQENQLSILINNAGCVVNKTELTEDGLEKHFATCTLG
ncbi:hypothetical protein GH733_006684, partial [Mirounga leonina]